MAVHRLSPQAIRQWLIVVASMLVAPEMSVMAERALLVIVIEPEMAGIGAETKELESAGPR